MRFIAGAIVSSIVSRNAYIDPVQADLFQLNLLFFDNLHELL